LARLLTERYGARLTVVDIEPKVDDIFEAIVAALDEPHADDSAIPTWFLSEAVGREYKVALTGIGGDELFAGYRRHLGLLAGAWYSKVPRSLRRAASALALRLPEPTDSSLGVDRVKRFLRSGDGDAAARFLAMISRIRDEERMALYGQALREELDGGAAAAHFDQVYRGGGSPQGLAAGLYLDYKTFLPDDILALSDRLAMAHSLEIRVPFVDHELVETVFPWPQATRIGRWRPKHLLRQALRSRLPEEILTAPKRGFVGPTAAWLRHELRPLLEDELAPSRMEALGYFQPEAVRGLLEDHFARRQNREGILWALLCFSVWHRVYVEEAASVAWP